MALILVGKLSRIIKKNMCRKLKVNQKEECYFKGIDFKLIDSSSGEKYILTRKLVIAILDVMHNLVSSTSPFYFYSH